MSFSQFIKPYPDGYEDFEAGDTPVTAEILNTNYDGFLLALNSWASDVENDIGDAKSDITGLQGNISSIQSALSDKVDTSTFNQLGDAVRQIGLAVNSKSTVSISDLLQSGTKVATLTIDGTQYDLYAPSGGGGGSSVAWNQIVSTGTKIATVTIDEVPIDVYAPTPIDELSDLTDVSIANLQDGQIIKWNSTTSKWENSNESSGGTGGHTIIDENGTSMTARAGLQFVGGANVSDDATNNRTIVDLASAGGIDGVFIDTDNVIQASTAITSSADVSYTATEDCVILFAVAGANGNSADVKINDIKIWEQYLSGSVSQFSSYLFVKKGQTVKFHQTFSSTDGYYIVYGIQTGTTHSKFQPVIYSTEERVIGVWKDGRPLYQKTVDFGALPNDTTKTVSYNIGDLDYFVMVQCVAHNQNGSKNIPFVDDAYKSGDVLLDTIKSSGVIRIIAHTDLSSLTGDVTLQYVKTTDVAGSGSWTPNQVPITCSSVE